MAVKLGKLPSEIEEMPNWQFAELLAHREIEIERHNKTDYYMAQIALCAIWPYLKSPAKINNFLIKLGKPEKRKLDKKAFRNLVCSWFGVNPEKKEK